MWSLFEYDDVFTAFLAQWDIKRQAKILYVVRRLRNDGNRLGGDFVDHIRDGVYELRITQNKQEIRILFFYQTGRKIFFVVCFEKRTKKTPDDKIRLAIKRKSEIELDEALADAIQIH